MAKMQCPVCDSTKEMKMKIISRTYEAGGLPGVLLKGVRQYTCEDCGQSSYNYGNIDALNKALAKCLYHKPSKLTGEEIAFIRKYLGFSQKMFAIKADMSEEHLCRIETGKNKVTKLFDAFMRLIVLTEEPCRDYDAHDKAIEKREAKKKAAKVIVLALDKETWRPKDKTYDLPINFAFA